MAELKHLVEKYDAASIFLLDDLFFAKRRRVFEIVDGMAREGMLGQLAFHGFITSNLATKDVLTAASKMGFQSIRFGAETGSDRLLKQMKGPHASVAAHQRCIDLCRELGLGVRAAFMFGTPGETVEDIEFTCEFISRNVDYLDIDGFYLTTPVPGTPYWDFALARKLVSSDMDWSRLNLDLRKDVSFRSSRAVYLNEENVPLDRLMEYVARIRDDFQFHQDKKPEGGANSGSVQTSGGESAVGGHNE